MSTEPRVIDGDEVIYIIGEKKDKTSLKNGIQFSIYDRGTNPNDFGFFTSSIKCHYIAIGAAER